MASPAAFAQASDGKDAKADRSCAQYGAGFQKMPGTDSCVRTGVVVRTDAYSGRTLGSAPNQFSGSPSGSAAPSSTDTSDPWKSAR